MTYINVNKEQKPIILLEGTRKVSEKDGKSLQEFAGMLARRFPNVIFRSGNAGGADHYFARGVEEVDPSRLELVLPYSYSSRTRIHEATKYISMDDLSEDEIHTFAELCKQATPKNKGLIDMYLKSGKNILTVKAMYLIRDVIKVTGMRRLGFQPAQMGIFYVDRDNPTGGGTGHTIRVCELRKTPAFTQQEWHESIRTLKESIC